ncbi:hypothetical protein LO772_10680 [Yinghuangia sp. ASG 101]|uniref:hypothetical protein n=1 Tax=Yinghuangia sp. ASG 101 TaxID=2896848 RepID=UPI001E37D33A|nr:hypothetical protein [Yinghuangia sp. ASG 101]UGQ14017.1 hypothetical protein LO772_10680 [Yinghuangia sp. ASG 101]
MDIKKLTRGDAVVAVAALLNFIFSFLAFFKISSGGYSKSWNAWSGDLPGAGASLVLIPLIASVLYILGGIQPRPTPILGLTPRQFATPLLVVVPLYVVWAMAGGPDGVDVGIGAIFMLLASLVATGAVVAAEFVPALKAPLGLGGGGGRAPQPGGAPYGGQPGYAGAPQGGSPYDSGPGQFGAQPTPGGAPAPAADFQPYWFSVPDQRPLVDATTNAPAGSLNPGVWYLAVAQHGQGLLVEVDGVRGVLWNVSGIQKS